MPTKWAQTDQEKIEVAQWVAGGPVTPAVVDAWNRNSLTFGAALITREMSDAYRSN